MKRVISGILATIIALCLSAPFVCAQEKTFTVTDNSFVSAEGFATREQAIACFIQAVGIERFRTSDTILERFSDMSKVSFAYRDAMSAAVYSGLISGYEDKTLRPQAPITRIESLVILARALSRTELSCWYSVEFSDTPDWAKKQVDRLASAGIVKGYGDGTLGARDYLTLEQVNTLCDRIARFTGPTGDFYTYVNSKWFDSASVSAASPIASDSVRLSQMVNSNISDIIFSLYRRYYNDGENFEENSIEKKIINVYSAAANQGYRDKLGFSPIAQQLSAINGAKNISELTAVMAELERLGFPTLILIKAGTNIYNTSMYLPTVSSGYLGIDATRTADKKYIESYKKYISTLFELSGEKNSDELAASVVEICEELASVAASPSGSMISNTVTVCDMTELKTVFKNLGIQKYFTNLGFTNAKSALVYDKLYTRTADSLLIEQNINKIKAYLKASVLDSAAPYLTTAAFNAAQEFSNAAYGTAANLIPSDYAVSITQELSGWELGSLYIDMYFPDNVKTAVLDITQKIIAEYEKLLAKNILMTPETRAKAIKKLKTMKIYAAYPDDIAAYCNTGISFRPIENGGSLMEYKMQYNQAKSEHYAKLIQTNQNAENDSWMIYPQTVNAMYDPISNSITIPAGLLQSPYFESSSEFEENLGGIGSVIAHEISHAFDSTGSQFDENGNLIGWWTAQDSAAFEALCNKIIDEYDNLNVNGTLTLNENLADIAGMSCILSLAGADNPKLDLLFTSYAEVWRTKTTDEYASSLLRSDPHSPAKIRVNRVLSNFDEFIQHYGIIEGDGMYIPEDKRIKIYN